jgi:hypothetical protein
LWIVAAACGRSRAPGVAMAQSSPQVILATVFQDVAGDAMISTVAAKRGRLPETRELGAAMSKTLGDLRDDLARAAQRRNIALPKQMEEKKIALRDNLDMLPGQVFDRGYSLAMTQDTDSLLKKFDAAGSDPDLRNIASKYRSAIEDQHRAADRLLSRLGGSPWPTAP